MWSVWGKRQWTCLSRRYYYSLILASERVQRRIDRLLDQIEEAVDQIDWATVRDRAQAVLALDREKQDALTFLQLESDPGPQR